MNIIMKFGNIDGVYHFDIIISTRKAFVILLHNYKIGTHFQLLDFQTIIAQIKYAFSLSDFPLSFNLSICQF